MSSRFPLLLTGLSLLPLLSACHPAERPPPAQAPLAPQPAPSASAPPSEEEAVDEHVRAIAAKACPAVDPEVCEWARGFLKGSAPVFAPAKGWTLGASLEVGEDGKRRGAYHYMVFATDPQHAASIGVMSPTTDNADEEKTAQAAVSDYRKGAPDPNNAFVAFIGSHLGSLTWLEESKSNVKSLVLAAPHTGPGSIMVRVSGDTLYFTQLAIGGSADDFDLRPHWLLGSAARIRPEPPKLTTGVVRSDQG